MAEFNMALTNKGAELLAKCIAGQELRFAAICMGDGTAGGSFVDRAGLVHQKMRLSISKITRKENTATLRSVLSFADITDGFYWRELGLFALDGNTEVLYAYGNAGDKADWIPPSGATTLTEKKINVSAMTATAANVTAIIDETLVYATQEDLLGKADKDLSNVDASALKKAVQEAGAMTEVVDSLAETMPGKALDAVQGKALKDLVDSKETPAGAQAKANVAEQNAKAASDPAGTAAAAAQELRDNPTWTGGIPVVTTYTPEGGVSGVDYAADVPGVTEPYVGLIISITLHEFSAARIPTLRINGGTAYPLREQGTDNSNAYISPVSDYWLKKNGSLVLQYVKANCWVVINMIRPYASDLRGYVTVTNGGTGLGTVPTDSYLVGNGTADMMVKTPEQVRQHIAAAKEYRFTVTVPTSGWAVSGGVGTLTVAVGGMTAAMNPQIIPQYSTDAAAAKLQIEAMGKLANGTCETLAGQVKFTVFGDLPGVQLVLLMKEAML